MASSILKQAQILISSTLEHYMASHTAKTQKLFSFLQNVGDVFDTCGRCVKQEYTTIMEAELYTKEQNQSLSSLQKSIIEFVHSVGHKLKNIGVEMRKQIQKYKISELKKLKQSQSEIGTSSTSLINQIKANLDQIQGIQQRISNNVKKSKVKTTFKRQNSLIKFDESKYRIQILITNKMWSEIQKQYQLLVEDISVYNTSRCQVFKNLLVGVSQTMSNNLSSCKFDYSIDQTAIKEQSEKIEERLVEIIQKKCGRSQLLPQFRSHHQFTANCIFQSSEQIADNMKKVESICEYFMIKSDKLPMFTAVVEQITHEDKWGEYFLSCFCSKLFTQITLNDSKQDELWSIIRQLFENIKPIIQQKIHVLYRIFCVCLKIRRESDGSLMIKQLRPENQYWEDKQLWLLLISYLVRQVEVSHSPKGIKSSTNLGKCSSSSPAKKYEIPWSKLIKSWKNKQHHNKSQHIYPILKQIGVILFELEISSNFTIKFLMSLSKKFELEDDQLRKLISNQHTYKKVTVKSYNTLSFKKRSEEYINNSHEPLIFAIRQCLIFLPVNSRLFQLLLVNKEFNRKLKPLLVSRCLKLESNLNLVSKYRAKLYSSIVPQVYSSQIYYKMKEELPISKSEESKQISFDVQRSLNWNPKLRLTLTDMLEVFTHYNDRIGYVQGMNYIAQHLLKLNLEEEAIYNIFEHIIVLYYSDIISSDFDKMRVIFYQFHRLMEIHLPNLHKHFESQKIEAEHYLVSWLMTLWGEQKGDMGWIMLDGMIIEGWEWWMKVSLWVLKLFEKELLKKNFEQILGFLTDEFQKGFLSTRFGDFKKYGVTDNKIKEQINKIDVSRKVLDLIKEEYVYVMKRIQQDPHLNQI